MSGDVCRVCQDVLDANRAVCNECGGEFHLALRIDLPARDCGDAWIDDEVEALVFGCNACLGRPTPSPSGRRYARHAAGSARAIVRRRRQPGDGTVTGEHRAP